MIVAMITMRMMQAAVHQVVCVIPMRDGFVAAAWTMDVLGIMTRAAARAGVRVGGTDLDHMLVDVILVGMMQVTVMQVIDVIAMLDCGMAAIRSVLVGMVVMDGAVMCHDRSSRVQWSSQA